MINIVSLSRSTYRYGTGVDKTSEAVIGNLVGVAIFGGIAYYMRRKAHSAKKKEIAASGGVGRTNNSSTNPWDTP